MSKASNRAGGRAEAGERPERPQAFERAWIRLLADAVIDHVALLAVGDLVHALYEILVAINDDMMGPGRLGNLGLVRRGDCADHRRAQRPPPLAKDEPDAARRRVDEHRVALLDAIGLAQEILRAESLEHDRRASLVGNAAGQLDEIPRLDVALLGVGADRAAVGDPVAGLEILDRRADLDDLARALVARRERQLRGL